MLWSQWGKWFVCAHAWRTCFRFDAKQKIWVEQNVIHIYNAIALSLLRIASDIAIVGIGMQHKRLGWLRRIIALHVQNVHDGWLNIIAEYGIMELRSIFRLFIQSIGNLVRITVRFVKQNMKERRMFSSRGIHIYIVKVTMRTNEGCDKLGNYRFETDSHSLSIILWK